MTTDVQQSTATDPDGNGKPIEVGTLPRPKPHHLADLRASGLSDKTIEEAGIYTEESYLRLATILNWKKYAKKYGIALVFPFYNELGDVVLRRIKPDNPPRRNGHILKYLQPTKAAVRAYIPRSVFPLLRKPEKRLFFTEGEKKALAGTQEGFPTIGLTGVECWHQKKAGSLIPDLEAIDWKNRPVFIAFDSDADTNPQVEDNIRLLAAALNARGAKVKVVRLPPGPPDAEGNPTKQGLDDYLVTVGVEAFHVLVNNAEEPEPPDTDAWKSSANEMDYGEEAKRLLATTSRGDVSTIRFWRDEFWRWQGGKYSVLSTNEIRAAVTKYLDPKYSRIGKQHISNVLENMVHRVLIPDRRDAPLWIDKKASNDWPPSDLLMARNAVVHLPSLATGQGQMRIEPTPNLFNTTGLEFKFTEVSDCPEPERWYQFLKEVWPDDDESIKALQLWFGYCLTPNTCQQKMLALFGPKRSGKGTIARVLTELVGKGNVASPTLSSFSQNFGLWPLLGKSLAIISDARLSGRSDAAVIAERFLSITGEDQLTIDRKFLPPVTCQLPTRLMLLSNELPRIPDASAALVSRMIVIRLTESWYGCEDIALIDTLKAELPGILWWAIHGWHQLRERGRLLQPKSCLDLVDDWERVSSPVTAFLDECCLLGPDLSAPRSDLYQRYVEWCQANGKKHIEDAAGFGRNLRAAVPNLSDSHPRLGGKKTRCYVGVGMLV